MARPLSFVLIAILSLALLACGGEDEDSSADPETPEFTTEQQIQAAIEVWYGKDKQAGCGILSEGALKSIGGIEKCLDNAADPAGTKVKVSQIEVQGETATAQAEAGGVLVPFELVLEDGQWLVESPTPTIY